MNLLTDQDNGRVPVTILSLSGKLDASNFEDLISTVRGLYEQGTRYLLLDMRELTFMGSSGLVALHSIAQIMRGGEPANLEAGWEAFHAIDRDSGSGVHPFVKLLSPQPKIEQTLRVTSMHEFFEIHTSRAVAIGSFGE